MIYFLFFIILNNLGGNRYLRKWFDCVVLNFSRISYVIKVNRIDASLKMYRCQGDGRGGGKNKNKKLN